LGVGSINGPLETFLTDEMRVRAVARGVVSSLRERDRVLVRRDVRRAKTALRRLAVTLQRATEARPASQDAGRATETSRRRDISRGCARDRRHWIDDVSRLWAMVG
jgi:hypothetical protein